RVPRRARARAGHGEKPLVSAPRVWVLNLDAEHELEAGPRFQPTQALRAIVARERRRLLGSLVAPGDIVLSDAVPSDAVPSDAVPSDDSGDDGPGHAPEDQHGHGYVPEGLAWSPTPRALARLAAAGARVPAAPALEVLR